MVELLLEAGADTFKANASGTTALMVVGTAAAGVSGIAIVEVRLAVRCAVSSLAPTSH